MKRQKLVGGMNGWIRIEQYNPMVLHIWLRDSETQKNVDCLITSGAIEFLQIFKNKVGYKITLHGVYDSAGYFVADEYYLEIRNPFRSRSKKIMPIINFN